MPKLTDDQLSAVRDLLSRGRRTRDIASDLRVDPADCFQITEVGRLRRYTVEGE